MKGIWVIISIFIIFLNWACSNSTSSEGNGLNVLPKFSSIQEEVFNTSCAFSNCHGGSQFPTLTTGLSYGNLVNVQSREKAGEILVIPGNSTESYLIKKLKGFIIVGEQMPKGSAPLPNAAIDSIAKWIDLGAKNN